MGAWHRFPSLRTRVLCIGSLALLSALTGCGGPPSRARDPVPSRDLRRETRPAGLSVKGNRLVDATGRALTLRGVNISGTEYACAQNHSDDPFGGQPEDSPQTLAAMRSWHIDVVRVPLNEDCWLGINGVRIGGMAYRAAIVNLVDDLERSGFYVILDLHWSAPGSARALAQNPAPDEDHSPAFWRSVAETFRKDPAVMFDLFNEPFFQWVDPRGANPWTCLWRGCILSKYQTGTTPAVVNHSWRSAGMRQLISVVRRAGAKNVILIAGIDWANDLRGWRLPPGVGPNVAISWHAYPNQSCSNVKCWDRVVAPLARHLPVIVTETGDSALGSATYLRKLLPWCDSHHVSYLAWTWNAWSSTKNVLVTNMETGQPTPGEGRYFRAHLIREWRRAQK